MKDSLVCVSHDRCHILRFRVLGSWLSRLVGLLGSNTRAEPVALDPCSSIHTWFMRYAIDVALVAEDGRVMASYRNVPPCRLVSCRGAQRVLERPSQLSFWPEKNDVLSMRLVREA